LLVAVEQASYRRPFVRYVHIGDASGEAGVDHRTGRPGERPDAGQDHPDSGDRLAQRRRVAGIDGMHFRRRTLGGQNPGHVGQWAKAASGQAKGQAARGQLGGDELTAAPRGPQ
jgi:hypothetical protein